MELLVDHPTKQALAQRQRISKPKWMRFTLLAILGYEALGCLLGGILLMAAPDGRYMDMPVDMMHGVFRDFLIPGIILTGLGFLNTIAFISILRKIHFYWAMSGLALGGLTIWFWVEIAILLDLHWLHFMWGMPVIAGDMLIISLVPPRYFRKALLVSGILS